MTQAWWIRQSRDQASRVRDMGAPSYGGGQVQILMSVGGVGKLETQEIKWFASRHSLSTDGEPGKLIV